MGSQPGSNRLFPTYGDVNGPRTRRPLRLSGGGGGAGPCRGGGGASAAFLTCSPGARTTCGSPLGRSRPPPWSLPPPGGGTWREGRSRDLDLPHRAAVEGGWRSRASGGVRVSAVYNFPIRAPLHPEIPAGVDMTGAVPWSNDPAILTGPRCSSLLANVGMQRCGGRRGSFPRTAARGLRSSMNLDSGWCGDGPLPRVALAWRSRVRSWGPWSPATASGHRPVPWWTPPAPLRTLSTRGCSSDAWLLPNAGSGKSAGTIPGPVFPVRVSRGQPMSSEPCGRTALLLATGLLIQGS